MRQIAMLFFLALLWACKKENEEPQPRFSGITHSGSTTILPVVYLPGDTVVKVGEGNSGYTLYFNKQKRLLRREEPVSNPYYLSELMYNSSGQVTELRGSYLQGNSWVYEGSLVFTYANGKMVNIREENSASLPGHSYDHQITWQGNDIVKEEDRLNQQTQCSTTFSYDGTKANPMRKFSNYYFVDGDANYAYYKLPYYFSEHLLTKQESDCALSETRLFNYTFTDKGLIESMSDQVGLSTGTIWGYEYEYR